MSETNGASDPARHRVAVIVPTTHSIVFPLVKWMFDQLKDSPAVTVTFLQHMSSGYVEDMRQSMIEGFLQACKADWLLTVDSDTVPRLSAIQMVEGAEQADVKIVYSPVPLHGKHGGVYANIYRQDERNAEFQLKWHRMPWAQKERYLNIHSAGLACALIHRSVIETMVNDARKGSAPWPFRGAWKDGRLVLSEDLAFCARLRRRGFKLYADLDNPCAHVKHWAMTPSQAIEDLPFHEPGVAPHPQAPRWSATPVGIAPVSLRSASPTKDYDRQEE